MAGPARDVVVPHGPVGRWLELLTGSWALFGGLVLVGLMIVESASVIGRGLSNTWLGLAFNIRGIAGDTEFVEVGCASAIFAFLPYCQLMRANVFVDFFTARLALRLRACLDLMANLLFLALATVLGVQTFRGCLEKFHQGDTTTVLRIPEALPYTVMSISAALLVVATLYTIARSMAEMRDNRLIGPQPSGGH